MDRRSIPRAGIEGGFRRFKAPKQAGDDRDLVILTHLRDLADGLLRLPPAASRILNVLVECGDNRSEAARRLYPGPKNNNRANVSRMRGRMVEAGRILFEGLLKIQGQTARPPALLQAREALESGRRTLPDDAFALGLAAAREAAELAWLMAEHPDLHEAAAGLMNAATKTFVTPPERPKAAR